MPAARSCDPATALNLTSTKPSLMLLSFLRSSGKVARPDCLSTFDVDGAVPSLSTVHFGSPFPVRVGVQPSGAVPIRLLSKKIPLRWWPSEAFALDLEGGAEKNIGVRTCRAPRWPSLSIYVCGL